MFGKKKNKNGTAISHLKNLYALAASDGRIDQVEEHLMISVATRLGVSVDEMQELETNNSEVEFSLPALYDDRVEQFQDLLMLVAADGRIEDAEVEFCTSTARKYQLSEKEYQQMIEQFRR